MMCVEEMIEVETGLRLDWRFADTGSGAPAAICFRPTGK